MKLKRLPEDFHVEELCTVSPRPQGRFTLYRLTKRGLGTLEAVEAIARRWNVASRRISFGGLKDRHAVTVQYLTILGGPPRPVRQSNVELEPLGYLPHPYGPQNFRGNRFRVVVRDLDRKHADLAAARLESVSRDGLPNYFDDQRFGSVGHSSQFIAQAWLAGDYEQALRLALAEPNAFDRSGAKAQKAVLRQWWGQWPQAKAHLERSSTRSIVTYLVDHPTDYRGAFVRLKRELRSLYFSAFQSHLWNLVLSGWIERNIDAESRAMVDLKVARLAFPHDLRLSERTLLHATTLPLPSARSPLPEGTLGALMLEVLAPFGLSWQALRVKHQKDVFLSKGTRAAMIVPGNLSFTERGDTIHHGRLALELTFELGKGSYATILIKRITEQEGPP
jgi:tRNA pseudouridine13 synthase